MEVINHRELIHQILKDYPPTRDNDVTLYSAVYQKLGHSLNLTVLEFLRSMKQGDIPHFETVRRTRQKLQEEDESVRGELYTARQIHGEDVALLIASEGM